MSWQYKAFIVVLIAIGFAEAFAIKHCAETVEVLAKQTHNLAVVSYKYGCLQGIPSEQKMQCEAYTKHYEQDLLQIEYQVDKRFPK